MRIKIYISLFVLVFFSILSYPQKTTQLNIELKENNLPFGLKEYVPEPKPVIALSLSGGGARGLSQIGVLKAFEEAGIEINLIAGTSMGSIVGGLYASGYTIEQLENLALTTDWNELLTISRQSNRRELFIDQKITEDKAVLTLRLDGFKPILPTSFNDGQKLSNYLNIITFNAPIHPGETFDILKRKFRAVSTNLVTGEPVIIKSGTLSKALRASSSVTFFLPPVQFDSLLLVDGGLVENIPVKTAKEEGGDLIIAVNTTSPLHDESKLSTPWVIADQIVSIPMMHLNNKMLLEADIFITPDLKDRTANNFNDIEDILLSGYNAAAPFLSVIKEEIDSLYRSKINANETVFKNPIISGITSQEEHAIVMAHVNSESITSKSIMIAAYELYELGNYEDIGVIITEEETITRIHFIKKEAPIIKSIDIIGSSAINSERTGAIFSGLQGKHYSGRRVLNTLIELLREYRTIGYSLANISEISFDKETGRLRIFVDEGIISSIVTEGNEYSNPNIIIREFPVGEGDYFDIDKISKGLINLRGTNLFEDAEAILRKENGKNVLVLRVVEKQTRLLRLGFSVDSEKRARIAADVREENLFGSGTELGVLFHISSKDRGFQFEQRANRIFNTYLTYKLNAFYEFDDISVYKDDITVTGNRFSREKAGEYRQIFYGASVGIGAQVERFGNLIFEGKYQTNKIKNIQERPASPLNLDIVSLKINSTVDTQDKYPYPESGIYFNGFYETAQTFLGGELGYTSVGFEYKNFLSLSSVSVLSTRIDMAFGDKTLPLTQQYSIGGMESFFGMRENEYRGRQLFLTSLMYRYKLPFSLFFETYLEVRYDLGNVWENQEQIKFKNLKHGIGASISFDTPIGPADFAVGRSFLFRKDIPNNPISWGDLQFYFSIGYYY